MIPFHLVKSLYFICWSGARKFYLHVHSWTKVYRIFFRYAMKPTMSDLFGGFLELRIRPNTFLQICKISHIWVQQSRFSAPPHTHTTISNLLNFRCASRLGVGKMWKRTISVICWISNKASIFVSRDMKYHTRWCMQRSWFSARKQRATFQINGHYGDDLSDFGPTTIKPWFIMET